MPSVIKVDDQTDLVLTKDFPYGHFPFEKFNPVQSRLVELFEGDSNIAIAAATSAGKTICSEMYLSYELFKRGGKGAYISPLKALAQEKLDEWRDVNHHFFGKKLSICTGDYRLTPTRKKELDESDLIIMTSEMLSSRCRNFKSEKSSFLREIGTLVIDESHLISVPGRGDHLENAIMKITQINPDVRLVLLSATMPNVDEICQWTSRLTNRDTYYLESKYRPCPLNVHYETYFDATSKYDELEMYKIESAMKLIKQHKDDKFLVFVHTKRTGELVKDALKLRKIDCEFHNANLSLEKRLQLEKKFKEDKNFRVLVATSTIAWGCHKFDSLLTMANGNVKKIQEVSVGDKVISFSKEKGKFEEDEVEFVWEHNAEESLEFTLSSGMVFEVTKDHIFYAAKGRQSPGWVEAFNLKEGDFLAVPKAYDVIYKSDEFDPYSYLCGYLMGDGCLVDCGTHTNGESKILLDFTIGQQDVDHIPVLMNLLEKISGYKLSSAKLDTNGVYQLTTKAKSVVSLFKEVIPTGRKGDSFVINASLYEKLDIKCLLMGLFDTDGGIENHKNDNWSVGFTSISKNLVKQVHELLLIFGIRSEIGKKKVKDTLINGRKVIAKREWIWRLRIYGKNLLKFRDKIGFCVSRKVNSLNEICHLIQDKESAYTFPARELLTTHSNANFVSDFKMCKICGVDKWSALNKTDLKESTIKKIIKSYPNKSALNDLVEQPILWKKIIKIEKKHGGSFVDLSIKNNKNYVCEGVISHNCNLPARRVIVLGVHRGLQEVENYDIRQMCGRAGRPKYDPQGDAYILLPRSKESEYKYKLSKDTYIRSQMLEDASGQGHYKVLAFHLVSEIHSGNVKTIEDIHSWYNRTLAYHQEQELSNDIVDRVIELLIKCKAIVEEDGVYSCTSIGVIASMYYFSPFDVSDLKNNFRKIFTNDKENDDFWLSIALANLDTHKFGIVNKAERAEMATYQSKINRIFGKDTFLDPVIKVGCAYFNMLSGREVPVFNALSQGLKVDASRLFEVIKAVDDMSGKWDKRSYLDGLEMRLMYGVKPELVELCKIPNIGKVRAEKLFAMKIDTIEKFLKYGSKLPSLLNMSKEKVEESLTGARSLQLKNMLGY